MKGEHMKKLAILIATIAVMTRAAYAQGTSPLPPNSPAAAGAGAAQADELPWAKLCMRNEQTGNKQICLVQHWGLDPKTGIVLGSASVRVVEGEDTKNLLVGVTTDYSLAPLLACMSKSMMASRSRCNTFSARIITAKPTLN